MVGSTPRALYNVKYRLKRAKFGEIFPEATLIAVIGKFPRFTIPR